MTFLYSCCPGCGMGDMLAAVRPLPTEFAEDYEARRAAVEDAARAPHADGVEAVVVPLQAP